MKIAIVNGYFDPLHIGHIELINKAKKLGKVIILLNNDQQAILKKGKYFMKQEERKIIMQNIKGVKNVILSIDIDKTVCQSLILLRKSYPNDELILAKGGDRFEGEIPETNICNNLNIKIVDGLGKKIQSSSELVKKKDI